jgi:superfamily II DNA or RNA helicase
LNLRPYQQQAINDLRAAFRNGAKAPLLVAPTGAGKTVIFSAIAAATAAKGRNGLILVHRRELVTQASRKLTDAGVAHGIIAAGMDGANASIQVASVQTLIRRLQKITTSPDLIIIDEAHHAAAGSWQAIINHWPDVLLIGVTATPCRLDGKGLGNVFDTLIEGPSVQMLTSAGYLSPARIYAPPMVADLSGVKRRAGDYAIDQAADAMIRPTVTGDAIKHYRTLAGGQQAIAFCCSVDHAVSVQDAFWNAGIGSALLLGETVDRDKIVGAFASGTIRILVTVDVVSEGFDIPAAGCAILLRPTQSLGLYLQQVGRVLRPASGKKHAIILDHVGNVTRHGFPDDIRQWTLEHGAQRSGGGQPAASVRTCSECFAAFKPAPICPCCGAECGASPRELKQVEGELVELVKDLHGQRLRRGDRVRLEEYPGKYFFFKGAAEGSPHLYQVCKKRKHCHSKVLNQGQIFAFQALHNDPLIVFNVFCEMVERSNGELLGQGKARTLPELLAVAKERGYAPGWAYRVHNARQQR